MVWYENYDFESDPFLKPEMTFGSKKVVDELVYRVESGSLVYIEGPAGAGKSSVLRKLIDEFGGKGKVIFFDCGQIDRKVNIELLMTGKYGFFGKMFKVKPKDMILLLDNANYLSMKNCERIKYYFDNNFVKSVIFTGTYYAKAHFSDSLRDRIGGRVVQLPVLSPDDAVKLTRERAPNVDLFTDDIIKKIYKQSQNNPKKFLSNLSSIAQKAWSDGEAKVTEDWLKGYFGGADGK